MKANPLFVCFYALACAPVFAQGPAGYRIPYGEPYSIIVAPDARSAGLGDAGVALSPDANATFWNPSKLAMADQDFGVSASYTPWLRNLVDGMWLGYATAYKKLGPKQAIGASVKYYDTESFYATGNSDNAYDLAFSGVYSRQLGQNFSMGLTLKYITSKIGTGIVNGAPLKTGYTAAADISAFYRKQIKSDRAGEDFNWSLGAILSNLGGKIDYGSGGEYFLPTALKIGGGVSYTATGKHRLNVVADLSKLAVPTPNNIQNPNSQPYFKGVWASFSDAPGGFKEEVQEIALSMGAEYWYKNKVALRGGYYGENNNKGARKFFTAGAGVKLLNKYTADISYLIPVNSDNPISKTFRVSVGAYFGGKKG
ncbi:type IX secretion system outer membrane channel protein PorV [Dyadobacter sp. CY323]|uniref:type IX secretion system outer membrane channel protein PorV n=1 Tax=Dyadobacter sp. CY323 TaxID=2907302 RepID=UPI001F1A4F6A|nr:type IX secretion system outer membrane channel protein PorV [Dyadobacter sp. CY323]MCE6989653.1 type IX secretion system outer membrane channel protein PorV [Dyadobacter sp. CY323]